MKKRFLALLTAAALASSGAATVANAAYNRAVLSEKIIMDSGRINMVEWERQNDSEGSAWKLDETDAHVTNLTGTGDSMVVEPYAALDLSEGDVRLSFDVIGGIGADAADPYGAHLYAVIEPEGEVASSDAFKKVNYPSYYLYAYDGIVVSSSATGSQYFYSDENCTVPMKQVADYTVFAIGEGNITFVYKSNGTLGMEYIDGEGVLSSVYIKGAIPEAMRSGKMCYGLSDWGHIAIDNLVLTQDRNIVSVDFEGEWASSEKADGKCYAAAYELKKATSGGQSGVNSHLESSSNGDPIGYIETVRSADLADGNVSFSFDIADAPDYHIYAVIEPAGARETSLPIDKTRSSSDAGKGTSNHQYLYAFITGGTPVVTTDYNYVAGEIDFYADEACTSEFDSTSEWCVFALGTGRITFTYTKNAVLGLTYTPDGGSASTLWIKDAFPADYCSGEMCFGVAFWSGASFDNVELRQGETVLAANDFAGEWNTASAGDNRLSAAGVNYVAGNESGAEDEGEENKYLSNKTGTGDAVVLEPYASADLSDGDVTLSFNLLDFANAAEATDYATHIYAIIEPSANVATSTFAQKAAGDHGYDACYYLHWHEGYLTADYDYVAGTPDFYKDKDCTELYADSSEFCAMALSAGKFSLTFSADRTLAITSGQTTVYIKDAFPEEYCSGDMCFGVSAWGKFAIDDLVLSQPDEIVSFGFDDSWSSAASDPEKCYSASCKTIKADGMIADDPSADQRLIMKTPIDVDENSLKVFDASLAMSFKALGGKFGFVFGLDEKNSATSEGSFIYFAAVDGKTHLVYGETDYDLGSDLTSAGPNEITVNGEQGGKVTVSVNGVPYVFGDVKLDGYFALACDGEGENVIGISKNFSVTNYSYVASETGEVATNFNTGYVDSDIWTYQDLKAHYLNEADRANGINFDGRLNMDGVGIMSYFATTKQYGDYILELDYIQPHDLPTTYANGGYLGAAAVCIAANSSSGYINSYMFSPFYYPELSYLRFSDYSTGVEGNSYNTERYEFYNADKDVVTAMKFVVANGNVSVYVQDITDRDFDKDAYVLLGSWDVDHTYGYVCIAGDEGGCYSFDNIRITPIDDPDPVKVEEKIASFVDRRPIDDEYVTLSAPVLKVEGNVVRWDAVKDAEGYEVTVDGEVAGTVTATEYTVSADGEHTVTVKAVGTARWIAAPSVASDEATVKNVAGESSSESESSGSDGSSGAKSGCFGSVGGIGMLSAMLCLAGMAIVKKRSHPEN